MAVPIEIRKGVGEADLLDEGVRICRRRVPDDLRERSAASVEEQSRGVRVEPRVQDVKLAVAVDVDQVGSSTCARGAEGRCVSREGAVTVGVEDGLEGEEIWLAVTIDVAALESTLGNRSAGIHGGRRPRFGEGLIAVVVIVDVGSTGQEGDTRSQVSG